MRRTNNIRKPLASLLIVGTLLSLVGLVLVSGCNSGREAKLGITYQDTIRASEGPQEGSIFWWYHGYYLNVEAGKTYEFTLTTQNGTTMRITGMWHNDKYQPRGPVIVEVDPGVKTRTASYTFIDGGKQKILVEAAQVPAEYSFEVVRR